MATRKFAPYTCVEPRLLQVNDSLERQEFVAGNCEKLADFLEKKVDNKHHNQGAWFMCPQPGDCNTVGCAFGWATMSGKFKGLQYAQPDPYKIVPIVNGREESFDNWYLAQRFFGKRCHDVFHDISLSRRRTVARLRRLARFYRSSIGQEK